jgi:hypothetical protein
MIILLLMLLLLYYCMKMFFFLYFLCVLLSFFFFYHADFVINLWAVKFCSQQITTELLFLLLFIALQLFFFSSFLIVCFLPAVLACNLSLICCQALPQGDLIVTIIFILRIYTYPL